MVFITEVMKKLEKYKIGLRTIKTAIAVMMCLLVQLLVPSLSALNASIAAIVCMRETPGKSWETGVNRFIGTLIGGAFGFIWVNMAQIIPLYNTWIYILMIPVGMILCISTCVWMKKFDAVIICCVVFLIITLDQEVASGQPLIYVGMRIIDTTLGIFFATLINKFFFPYKGKPTGLSGIDVPKYLDKIAADSKLKLEQSKGQNIEGPGDDK